MDECRQKYGPDIGEKIWETTNSVFDKLPVCAVIDGQIFCAHGGIPKSPNGGVVKISEIQKLPFVLADPQQEAPIAWNIIWSDPLNMPQFKDLVDFESNAENDHESGFVFNPKRGTAHYFNEIGASKFLAENNLRLVVYC